MTGTGPPPSSAHAAFLRAERPDDVLVYLPDRSVSDPSALADHGRRTDDGTVLVLPGERGRAVLQRAAGLDPMALPSRATRIEGALERDCTGGSCPEATPAEAADHGVRLVFAFAEPETAAAGGPYADGDVVHAYAVCDCGTAYGDRWVVEEV